jgi:hypothetical protein
VTYSNPDLNMPAVRTPADLLALLPYLIGYTPVHSLVAVGLDQARIVFAARVGLPNAGNDADGYQAATRETVATLAAPVLRQTLTSVMLVGYGPREQVARILELATGVFTAAGVPVDLTLRVSDGRWFHDNCTEGCPPEGTAFDPASSPAAAQAVYAGLVALPDRAAYAAQLDPTTGPERDAME